MCPRRPPYVNDCAIRISQAKVETPVIRGKIASSGSGESSLSIYTNSRAKSVTAAARAAKGNCQPVSLAAPIHQHNGRSEEHTSELQSRLHLVCRLLLEKKNQHTRRCV